MHADAARRASALAGAARHDRQSQLGDSLVRRHAGRRARATTGGRSSLSQATGLGTTFVPSIIGFGAVLDNLGAFLDNLPMATTIAGATAAWLVLWSFLSGGVLDRYARMRPTRASGILCRVRHAFLALPPAWRPRLAGVLGALQPRAPVVLRRPLSVGDAQRDRGAHRRLPYARLLLPRLSERCSSSAMSSSTTRASVSSSRIAAAQSARCVAGARFVRRHPATLRLYLLNGAGFVLLALLYALVAPGAPSGLAIWIALAHRAVLHRPAALREAALLRVADRVLPGKPRSCRLYGGAAGRVA